MIPDYKTAFAKAVASCTGVTSATQLCGSCLEALALPYIGSGPFSASQLNILDLCLTVDLLQLVGVGLDVSLFLVNVLGAVPTCPPGSGGPFPSGSPALQWCVLLRLRAPCDCANTPLRGWPFFCSFPFFSFSLIG